MSVEFTDNSDEILGLFETATHRGLDAIGITAERHAKKRITEAHAVVTGRLRNSVSHAVKGKSVYVGTNVKYAPGIELGTHRKAGAVHFLQDAALNHSDEYKRMMEAAMKD